ncbi:hypothetical protein HRI_001677300 [Hibiscus trionum]|uniref:Reverse transcriptase/retrotransposon-derived protein RNase H-like domain-containing protein n=1 Tax=Hibiscus trionum TaxID=183268 RepID=A0A9W7HQD9_HIBTR|nr:hypothetical protein HRI_001677300 [Hibiscus trionum]
MCKALVLALPDFSKPFCLETNASSKGMGAILSQGGGPYAYLSKSPNTVTFLSLRRNTLPSFLLSLNGDTTLKDSLLSLILIMSP